MHLHNGKAVLSPLAFTREQAEETAEPPHHLYMYIYILHTFIYTYKEGKFWFLAASPQGILVPEAPFQQVKSSEEAAVAGNTYGHGVVEGVVVDTGSQGEIQHTALKQL